jgi:5'-methylthioadenosine phosphorylase
MVKIGIIGGSGVDNPDIIGNYEKRKIETKFGKPSDSVTLGKIKGVDVAVLARHGAGHTIMPSLVNYRANIQAMKRLGVTHILATTACGSLKEEIRPGDFVILDQFFDRTYKRETTLYEEDKICHLPMAHPFCDYLREVLIKKAKELNFRIHDKGTVVTIEGPRFSTLAESEVWRKLGFDVVNMTTVPECVLAREAGIHYASIAMVTDYDCWKEDDEVSVNKVMETMKKNKERVLELIKEAIPVIEDKGCKTKCNTAFQEALM